MSSPNTPGLRTLQYGEALDDLLTAIKNKQNDLQAMHHKYVPDRSEDRAGSSLKKN
ncbi:hypothetical protein OH690_10425 [Escherichia coli]|nr:hypothetical protein [Escherichia coli]